MSYHGLGTISPAMRWGATTGTAVNTANSQNTSLIPASGSTASTTPQTLTTNTVSRTDSNSLITSGSSLSTSPQRTTLPSSSEDGSSVSVEDADGLVTIRKPDASATQRDTSMIPLQTAALSVSTSRSPSFDDRAVALATREAAARQQANIAAGLRTTLSVPATTNTYRSFPSGGSPSSDAGTPEVRMPVSPVQLPSEEEEPFYKNPVVVGGGILLLLVAAYAINKSRG